VASIEMSDALLRIPVLHGTLSWLGFLRPPTHIEDGRMVEIGRKSYRVMKPAHDAANSKGGSKAPNPLRAEHTMLANFTSNKLTTYVLTAKPTYIALLCPCAKQCLLAVQSTALTLSFL
jgi:hypothetical protein